MPTSLTWDIFCSVVDNFGDAGVSWRLARQLVAEHGQPVRLWINDLPTLQRIVPSIDARQDEQICAGVNILSWHALEESYQAADVVVQAFGCALPETVVRALLTRYRSNPHQSIWINLEYLSAEDWVESHHGLTSLQPQTGLHKYFFFPGFTKKTGGLLREAALSLALQNAPTPRHDSQIDTQLGVSAHDAHKARIFLFGYANPHLPALLSAWSDNCEPLLCLTPEGAHLEALAQHFGCARAQIGSHLNHRLQRGALTVQVIPFVAQSEFDALLNSCDLLFVRGEDSFVRAQWAAKPFVWQIYPQAEQAHHIKLQAFMQRYTRSMSPETQSAFEALWGAWNQIKAHQTTPTPDHGVSLEQHNIAHAWQVFFAQRHALHQHACAWRAQLQQQTDCCTQLVNFVRARQKQQAMIE